MRWITEFVKCRPDHPAPASQEVATTTVGTARFQQLLYLFGDALRVVRLMTTQYWMDENDHERPYMLRKTCIYIEYKFMSLFDGSYALA